MLQAMAQNHSRERIEVADLLADSSDRAHAALLLAFAIPNLRPLLPRTAAMLKAPLVFPAERLGSKRHVCLWPSLGGHEGQPS
jgi:hypothetical protein